MNLAELKQHFHKVRGDVKRVQAEQAALPHVPAPDYLPTIGAFAEDDPCVHHGEVKNEPKLVEKEPLLKCESH